MPRSKSIPGSKTSRAKDNKPQTDATAARLSAENVTAATPVEVAPEVKASASVDAAPYKSNGGPAGNGASESNGGSEGRRFEVLKAEGRKNLVPINLEDEIRRRAYELYEQRGASSGNEADDWFTAEREVRQRYRQQSA